MARNALIPYLYIAEVRSIYHAGHFEQCHLIRSKPFLSFTITRPAFFVHSSLPVNRPQLHRSAAL